MGEGLVVNCKNGKFLSCIPNGTVYVTTLPEDRVCGLRLRLRKEK